MTLFDGRADGIGAPGVTIETASHDEEMLGAAVAGLGDVDGDGLPEIGVTAVGWDGRYYANSPGKLYGDGWDDVVVTSGSPSPEVHLYLGGPDGLPAEPAASIAADDVRALLGPGDIDGDGRADVIVYETGMSHARVLFGTDDVAAWPGRTITLDARAP